MNPDFLPNTAEESLIQVIQKYCRDEFALIRMSKTMLDKSIIDASDAIRIVMRESGIVDYDDIAQGGKAMKRAIILSDGEAAEEDVSYYRPKTKSGDPRFWIYKFKRHVSAGVLVYFTVFNGNLIAIPLAQIERFESALKELFGPIDDGQNYVGALTELLQSINGRWIPSISPDVIKPRDVGETLEKALGLDINNFASADFQGEIEIKAKRAKSKTKDTLFSKVPDWKISPIGSASNMIIKYGYLVSDGSKYDGYMSLFITVSNSPNKQNLFMADDAENARILQIYSPDEIVCRWKYDTLRDTLYSKHPKTVWISADERRIDGSWHFAYNIEEIELTERPIFAQFVSLIGQGIITYDWRGRVMPDKTKYRDHGHCFRIVPSERHKLFGTSRRLIG